MTNIEKSIVNRPGKGAANARRIETQLDSLAEWGGATALELGCGTGEVAAYLAAERGYFALGVDVDPEQISLAQSRHGTRAGLDFAEADATRLDYPSASFDLVVSQNVFHHIPDWPAVVSEISRVLRPGGHVLWLDLTPSKALVLLLQPLRSRIGLYTMADIRSAFLREGLTEVMIKPMTPLLGLRHEAIWRKP